MLNKLRPLAPAAPPATTGGGVALCVTVEEERASGPLKKKGNRKRDVYVWAGYTTASNSVFLTSENAVVELFADRALLPGFADEPGVCL